MLKRDVFFPVDGKGPILVDGTTHTSMAVCLKEKKMDTREQLEWRQLGNIFLHLPETDDTHQEENDLPRTIKPGPGLKLRPPVH